ncbi:MAG: hypothetical protein RXN87_05145 [Acidilobus sp.]
MNRVGKLALVAGILAIALAVPMAAAHLIYLYEANVTVKPVTYPIVWLYGSSSEVSAVNLKLSNTSNPQISLTIPVTNSSGTYVSQALEVKAIAGSPYLYVASCSYTPGPNLTSVKIIVYPTGGSASSPTGTITITPSSTSCTASGYVQLTAGTTYYVDFQVEPTLPIKYGASSGTLLIYFGVSNESGAVSIPPP